MDHQHGRIVVGMDGSAGSQAALTYALQDAARRGAAVDVVVAFAPPEYWVPPVGVPPISPDEIREAMQRYVESAVAEVTGELRGELAQIPPVTVRTVTGSAAKALLEAAEGADLLVVGSRGHGGFGSVLLGSVSLRCTLHATCPITVVHGAEQTTTEEPAAAGATTLPATPTPA